MINVVVLGGRLITNPETKTAGAKTVTTFRLVIEGPGTTSRRVDRVSVECSNRAAVVCQNLVQGRYATVQGTWRHDEWTGADGERHARDYVIAEHIMVEPE